MLVANLINTLTILLISLGPMMAIVWLIIILKNRSVRRLKNPINNHLLRSPGQSLLEQIEDVNVDFFSHLLMTPFISLLLYVYYLTSNKKTIMAIALFIVFASCLNYWGLKIYQLFKTREKLRLGYDAELAVGQELNLLMREGFYVYHDVNLKNTLSEFNIDHVVVGETGVFAIETKGRSKPTSNIGKDSSKVIFDGNKLVFPLWEESEPIEQAKRQANAVQKWLTSAVGEPIKVKAVLALPGWYTSTNVKNLEIAVINGKSPEKFFNVSRDTKLSEKQINQIAHQLESLCRNVEPKAYSLPK